MQKTDSWTGTHDFSWGPGGIVHDTAGPSYTPGLHQQSGGTDRFSHSDWLGSTRYLSDGAGTGLPSGLRYDAFGNRSATTGPDHPTDFQFAGGAGYQQEYRTGSEPGVGLQYLEQRYYDPAVGRFISPDPIRFDGGLNLYDSVEADPVNAVDPSGLAPAIYGLDDSPENDAAFTRNVGTARFLMGASTVGASLKTAIEVGGSFNPATNLGLAANEIGEGRYGSAALRALGPVTRLFGKARGLSRLLRRPARPMPGQLELPIPDLPPANSPWRWHHVYPMYLGGPKKGMLVRIPKWYHDAIHAELDRIYPRQAGKGSAPLGRGHAASGNSCRSTDLGRRGRRLFAVASGGGIA